MSDGKKEKKSGQKQGEAEEIKEENATESAIRLVKKLEAEEKEGKALYQAIEPRRKRLAQVEYAGAGLSRGESESLNLRDAKLFYKLVDFTRIRREKDEKQYLVVDEKATPPRRILLRKTDKRDEWDSDAIHPYTYFERNQLVVTYEMIGEQLAKYSDKTIELLMRIALKVMRGRDITNDLLELDGSAKEIQFLSSTIGRRPAPFKIMPREFLGMLIGTAACEAGRGKVGFINLFASFHRVKHYAENRSNERGSLQDFCKIVFHSAALATSENRQVVNAVGFDGSAKVLGSFSQKKMKADDYIGIVRDDSKKKEEKVSDKTYSQLLKRDMDYFSEPKKPTVQGSKGKQKSIKPDERFMRKVVAHLEYAFTGENKPSKKTIVKEDDKKNDTGEKKNEKKNETGGHSIGSLVAESMGKMLQENRPSSPPAQREVKRNELDAKKEAKLIIKKLESFKADSSVEGWFKAFSNAKDENNGLIAKLGKVDDLQALNDVLREFSGKLDKFSGKAKVSQVRELFQEWIKMTEPTQQVQQTQTPGGGMQG